MPPSTEQAFQALRTYLTGKVISSRIETLSLGDLSPGEVVIRSLYAGVNYKDCLAVTGAAKIMTSFPRIGGIEIVGEILQSTDAALTVGKSVMIHGFRTGVEFDGGFSWIVRAPASHVTQIETLSPEDAAIIGLPGFTAALALDRFEQNGIRPGSGPIAVSGAFGAVGVLAISILARAGYEVVALTRRTDPAEQAALRKLGASDILNIAELGESTKLLERPRFAAAIDNVGARALPWLLKSLKEGGCVASVGNAGGNEFAANVLPFIIREVTLIGIVANASHETRQRLWRKLSTQWKPDLAALAPFVSTIALDDLPRHCATQVAGNARGRTLVAF